MNNLSASLKKFLGNKNTVTILGVLLCMVILVIGYNRTINSKIKLTQVPYSINTIQPKTLITSEMVGVMSVPEAFIKVGKYYKNVEQVVGKYSNYNTVIAQGSLFYTDLLTEQKYLPDSYMYNVPEGYTVINYPVTMSSTYANSMMPESYINIYFKATLPASENEEDDEDKIMFGKFISNVEVLSVKDAQGQHVFENTEEVRTPSYMLFAVPEEYHLLLRKALYLQNKYSVEILIIPNTVKPDEVADVSLTSAEIKSFIEARTKTVDVTDLPPIEDAIEDQNNNQENQNNENNQTEE